LRLPLPVDVGNGVPPIPISMDLKDIKVIVDLMKKNAVSEFEMEEGDFKIKLKRDSGKPRKGETVVVQEAAPMILPAAAAAPVAAPVATAAPAPATPAAAAPAPVAEGPEVKSPMIGTFYRKPSPDADSYVEVGSVVEPDTVVCIIEAMKVMNEIKAEVKGTIAEVLVEDGKPVEYGQALFRIEPN
jgi:acetyl-CoA carboxylase biotin carboxyl carrier protein